MSRTKIAALFAAASVAVTGGSAFTASIAEGTSGAAAVYLGTFTSTVSGGTLDDVNYTLDAAGDNIIGITVVFTANDFDDEHLYVTPYTAGPTAGTRTDCDRKDSTLSGDDNSPANANNIDYTGKAVFVCGFGGQTTNGGNAGITTGAGIGIDVATLIQLNYRVAPGA